MWTDGYAVYMRGIYRCMKPRDATYEAYMQGCDVKRNSEILYHQVRHLQLQNYTSRMMLCSEQVKQLRSKGTARDSLWNAETRSLSVNAFLDIYNADIKRRRYPYR